jgi:preprotein translocase subunit YajC
MSGNDLSSMLFLVLPLLLLGWIMVSQRRRMRDAQSLQASIAVGDEIRTTSGFFGRVTDLTDTVLSLELAPGVVVRIDRRAVDTKVPPAATPAAADDPQSDGPTDQG